MFGSSSVLQLASKKALICVFSSSVFRTSSRSSILCSNHCSRFIPCGLLQDSKSWSTRGLKAQSRGALNLPMVTQFEQIVRMIRPKAMLAHHRHPHYYPRKYALSKLAWYLGLCRCSRKVCRQEPDNVSQIYQVCAACLTILAPAYR